MILYGEYYLYRRIVLNQKKNSYAKKKRNYKIHYKMGGVGGGGSWACVKKDDI